MRAASLSYLVNCYLTVFLVEFNFAVASVRVKLDAGQAFVASEVDHRVLVIDQDLECMRIASLDLDDSTVLEVVIFIL